MIDGRVDSELLPPIASALTPMRRSGLAPKPLLAPVPEANADGSANSAHSCRGGASFRSIKSSDGAASPPKPSARRVGLVERMRAESRSGVSDAEAPDADAGLAFVEFGASVCWRPLFEELAAELPPVPPVPVPAAPPAACEWRSFAFGSLCAGFSSLAARSSASAAARSSSDAPPNSGGEPEEKCGSANRFVLPK